jgi:uncharacterized FAD-dependent dehydrogenase
VSTRAPPTEPPAELPTEVDLTLGLDEPDDGDALRQRAARALGVSGSDLGNLRVVRRAIDARKGKVRFALKVALGDPPDPTQLGKPWPVESQGAPRAIIVGDGPCGLFCAYELARRGIRSVVVDRGKTVQPRRIDLKGLNRLGVVDADSNYCFGEGGAGTYSDGKLYTRSTKRGDIRDVLETFVLHQAPLDILTDARPHIGSNLLPKVITAMRERLEQCGVQFRFGARVVDLLTKDGAVTGVQLSDGEQLLAGHVVIATGHSARDVYRFLHAQQVPLQAKPFAVGVRIEHPQPLIDELQYGKAAGHPKLLAAAYSIVDNVGGRGVYSFCMCPGGFVVEDAERAGFQGPFACLEVQQRIEQAALQAGGGKLRAPATRAADFVRRRASSTVQTTSYQPGLLAGDIAPVLDASGVPIADRLRSALAAFERRMPGYGGEAGVLIGVESRTSAPVRIVRDDKSLMSPALDGLFPAGEGAGYAGGIISAALDGIRVAKAIADRVAVTTSISRS